MYGCVQNRAVTCRESHDGKDQKNNHNNSNRAGTAPERQPETATSLLSLSRETEGY
jgi:hypothetical protein